MINITEHPLRLRPREPQWTIKKKVPLTTHDQGVRNNKRRMDGDYLNSVLEPGATNHQGYTECTGPPARL